MKIKFTRLKRERALFLKQYLDKRLPCMLDDVFSIVYRGGGSSCSLLTLVHKGDEGGSYGTCSKNGSTNDSVAQQEKLFPIHALDSSFTV
jgi:hypothetical protein